MAGWRYLFVAATLLGGSAGCCSYCDSTYARRHPVVAAPAYGSGCVPCPCQPVQQPCCPCPAGYAPVAGAVSNSVPPPPPPPPGQPVSNWQRAPGNGCCP